MKKKVLIILIITLGVILLISIFLFFKKHKTNTLLTGDISYNNMNIENVPNLNITQNIIQEENKDDEINQNLQKENNIEVQNNADESKSNISIKQQEKNNVEENTNENTTSTLDNEPKTGFNNPISFVITVLVISCLGLAICIRKMSK